MISRNQYSGRTRKSRKKATDSQNALFCIKLAAQIEVIPL